jgi:hypothetical protein
MGNDQIWVSFSVIELIHLEGKENTKKKMKILPVNPLIHRLTPIIMVVYSHGVFT